MNGALAPYPCALAPVTVYGRPDPLSVVAALAAYHPARVAVALAAYAHRHPSE